MKPYTIKFKTGEIVDGIARWDGECLEDLLVELGLKASDVKRIDRVLADRRPYESHCDARAREKARAA